MLFSTWCCMPQFHALTFPCLIHFIHHEVSQFHLLYSCHMSTGLCLSLFCSPHWFSFTLFLEFIPIEGMEPVKEPDSQESQPPAVPEVAPTSTSTSPPPLTETVLAEELEVLRQFRASSTRSASPAKKAKTASFTHIFHTPSLSHTIFVTQHLAHTTLSHATLSRTHTDLHIQVFK